MSTKPLIPASAGILGRVMLVVLIASWAIGEVSAQQVVFSENVEAVEQVDAAMRRRVIQQFRAAEGGEIITVEAAAPIHAEAPPAASAPAPAGRKGDDANDAEAKAIAAHRAKAAAARAEAERKIAKDKTARFTAAQLVDQVRKQIGVAQPIPAAPAPPVVVAPEVRWEAVQVQRVGEDGRVVIEAQAVPVMVQAMPVPLVAPPVPGANRNPNEQLVLAQIFQPLLQRELEFATAVCGLDDAQSKSLTEAANDEVLAAVRAYIKERQQPRRMVNVNGVQRVEPRISEPRQIVETCLVASLKKAKLSNAVVQLYTEESARRGEFRRQAGIEAFVAAVDDRVFLDAEQRQNLAAMLEKHWQDDWAPYVDAMLYNSQLNLPIPSELLLPILRQEQKDVWQTSENTSAMRVLRRNVAVPQFNFVPAPAR